MYKRCHKGPYIVWKSNIPTILHQNQHILRFESCKNEVKIMLNFEFLFIALADSSRVSFAVPPSPVSWLSRFDVKWPGRSARARGKSEGMAPFDGSCSNLKEFFPIWRKLSEFEGIFRNLTEVVRIWSPVSCADHVDNCREAPKICKIR